MIRETIPGKNGYHIPCLHNLSGGEKSVCVISHGFGSSKDSPTAGLLAQGLGKYGAGVLAFDFPAHGESPVDGSMLSIRRCMDDLASAEARALELAPGAVICYFASSFGAYINLLYLSCRPHRGSRAFLRSAAVEMPKLLHARAPEERAQLSGRGYLMLDMAGYVRPLKLTREFLADLDAHDLFQLYRKGAAQVAMVHGDRDDVAPLEAAQRFAHRFGTALTVFPGGGHSLDGPGMAERVLRLAGEFFAEERSPAEG